MQRVRKLAAAIWAREGRERVRSETPFEDEARERERQRRLLRRLWTGRCANFKGPIPIFNLLRDRVWGEWAKGVEGDATGVKAKPIYRLDPCRPSIGFRVFSTAEEFHFKSFPSERGSYEETCDCT